MRVLSFVALTVFLSVSVFADPPPGMKRKGPGFGGPAPDLVERFSRMTPSERREMMERRLENWANTPPEERQRLQGSYARFQEMSPERQQEIRQLFRRFSETFEPERRPKAQHAARVLKKADPEERKRFLSSRP